MSNIDQSHNHPANNPNDPTAAQPDDVAPPPAPKRKKRRWLKVLGVLVLFIIVLVVCAPWLAGTAPVRNIVVSQINKNINGTVAIDDYSVGWMGGIKASGIKVYDAQKNLMLSVPRVSTQLSLLGAMRGDLNLGDTVIDVKLDKIVVDENGNVNLAELAKQQPAQPTTDQPQPATPAKTEDKEDDIELPNIKGKLTVNVLGGSVEGAGVPAPITIDPSTIVLNIPDINQPITNDIKLAYRVGNAKPSAISVIGSIDAVENGEIDLATVKNTLKAQQKIALQDVDLSAASAVVKDAEIGGIVNGALDVNAQGITGISANGEFIATNVEYAGPALEDRLVLDRLSIPIQVTRTQIDANNALIKIERLGVDSSLVKLNVVGQVQEVALNNIAAKQKPGGDGQINIDLVVPDFGAVARALPKTMKLQEGVTINTGSLTNSQSITITRDDITSTQKLDLAASGRKGNQDIRISPVHLETAATIVPTGKDMPDVRKLNLALTSAFATITGGGDSLAKIGIDGNFDLAKLQNELAQFVDLGGKQFAGTGQFKVTTNGDVTQTAAPIVANLSANLADVRVVGVAEQPIDLSRATLTAGGTLQRDANGKLQSLDKGTVHFQSGDERAPLVNLVAHANIAGLGGETITAPWFKLEKCEVSKLDEVQRQYGALVPVLKEQGIELRSGAVYANVEGSFDGKTVTLTQPLAFSMPNIVVNKNGQQVLGREDISGRIAGTVALGDTETKANLSEMNIGAKSGLFSLVADQPLNVTLAKSGGIAGNGAIKVGADIGRASAIAQAFGGNVQTSNQVTSGKLDGTLTLTQAQDTTIKFDGNVVNLTVNTNGQQAIKNETVAITLDATATGDMKGVTVRTANIASTFANAKVTDASLALGGAPLEMVSKANVEVDVPNLPAVYGLMNAFAPPEAAKPQAAKQSLTPPTMLLAMQRREENLVADAPAAVEPIVVQNGSARIKLTVDRPQGANATTINLSEMRVSKLELARGKGKPYAFARDIDLKLQASLANKGDAIESLTVNQLAGDLGGVATIAMPEKITVTSPQDKPQANGAIKLDGTIDALTPLLAVLQGAEPLPYSGTYSLTQKIATVQTKDGLVINLEGNMSAPEFRMLENGKPAFEDSIEVKNNVGAYLDTKTATIRTLSVTMPKTNALAVNIGGRVIDWEKNRTLRDTKVDLTYDLATLWKIAFPMLSPEMREQYKDLKLVAKRTSNLTFSGAFPARDTIYESFKSLNADGGIGVELADLPQGVTAQVIEIPFRMKGGVVEILQGKVGERPPLPEDTHDGKANGPGIAGLLGGGDRRQATGDDRVSRDAPAQQPRDGARAPAILKPENGYANTGALNLAGITIDLTTPHLNVTIPKDKQLLQQVRLNPVLADTLGKVGAVLLVGSSTAEGLVNLRVAEFHRVPIGDLTARDRHANATLVLNVDDLKLDGIVTRALAMALGTDALTGRISDSTISIANGQANTNLTMLIDKSVKDAKSRERVIQGQPLKLTGGVTLADLSLRDFMVNIAPELIVSDLRKYFPSGLSIPMRGKANDPKIDFQKAIAENAVKGLIPGATGGDKSGDGKTPSLEDILKGIGGKDKKKDDKK